MNDDIDMDNYSDSYQESKGKDNVASFDNHDTANTRDLSIW